MCRFECTLSAHLFFILRFSCIFFVNRIWMTKIKYKWNKTQIIIHDFFRYFRLFSPSRTIPLIAIENCATDNKREKNFIRIVLKLITNRQCSAISMWIWLAVLLINNLFFLCSLQTTNKTTETRIIITE